MALTVLADCHEQLSNHNTNTFSSLPQQKQDINIVSRMSIINRDINNVSSQETVTTNETQSHKQCQ
jgi:hypothetical protein